MAKDKNSSKKEAKSVNILIAPYNWARLQKYIEDHNKDPDRSSSKLKFTDVINEVLKSYFLSVNHNIK
ncbi:MAG: hypothetical protein ABSG94_04935 [Brevinematales bacterium]|jgi:hypothetical protein